MAMLDSTPIARLRSSKISTQPRSPRFHEHIAEMDDTSQARITLANAATPPKDHDTESPTLGRDELRKPSASGSKATLADDVRRRQHLMSWNNYDPDQPSASGSKGEEIGPTMAPRTPPSAGARNEPDVVSPYQGGRTPRSESEFVVSLPGKMDFERKSSREC